MNPKIIAISAILILSLMAGIFLVFPQFQNVLSVRSEIAVRKESLEKKLAITRENNAAILEFQAMSLEKKELADKALPGGEVDLPNLLFLLDSLVSSSGMIIQEVGVGKASAQKGEFESTAEESGGELEGGGLSPKFISSSGAGAPEARIINLTVRGGYGSFKALLQSLESSLRIFDIETISFSSPKETKEGFEIFRFSTTLKTYFVE